MKEARKLKPLKGGIGGCLNCGYVHDIAPMDMLIAVGFGDAQVIKNGKVVYCEIERQSQAEKTKTDAILWTTQDAENEALKDENADWRIILNAPLSGRTYQRQGKGKWYLVKKNTGFM